MLFKRWKSTLTIVSRRDETVTGTSTGATVTKSPSALSHSPSPRYHPRSHVSYTKAQTRVRARYEIHNDSPDALHSVN
jgi:hypothetical protein